MSNEVARMSKNDKQRALVPRLRFPEFRDAPGWTLVPLQQLAERITTRNSDESTTRVLTNSAAHGVVDQRDYFDKDIATKGNLGSYHVVNHGDYVYNPRISAAAPVGPISRNNIDQGVMSPLYTVFRFNRSETDFYEHYFKSSRWHAYLRSVSSMGARHDRMSITNGDFMRMPVPDPHPKEQQKIADCLGSLNDLLAAEGRKLGALREHKEGLMQQLFPREGETRPRLRFPEFRDAPGWEESTVGDAIATLTPPKRLPQSMYSDEGRFPIVDQSPSAICGRTDDADAVITEGLPVTVFGDHTCTVKYVEEPFAQGADGIKILKARPFFDDRFLFYSLQARPLKSNQYKRHFSTLKKQRLVYPDVDSGEQQRITDCLAFLDAMISAQVEKLDALRTHKRGLMQQLFPSLEAATGSGT
jgi:type I restriction enzyme, S subunit